MNIEEYISSGAIEAYVMGIATQSEAAEVERYAQQYPQIRQALEESRNTLEQFAAAHSQEPPSKLKEKIWQQIQADKSQKDHTKIITPPVNNMRNRSHKFSWLAAASVILFLCCLGWSLLVFQKNNRLEKSLVSIQKKQQELEKALSQRDSILYGYQQFGNMLADSNMLAVEMKGVGTHLNMQAIVLWNKQSNEVYLSVNNLPQPPQGKQYQLWAIVDGKPVDMGVFDAEHPLQKMKTIAAAQMFAVTLEKEGGSSVPTLEQMYVAGKI